MNNAAIKNKAGTDALVEYIGIADNDISGYSEVKAKEKKDLPEGFTSDAKSGNDVSEKGFGLIYEIAEELYIKEKTVSELEALARPPFRRNFDENTRYRLDRQAVRRKDHVLSSAREASYELSFLPESAYEESCKPMETRQALLTELLMLIPFVNIAAAVFVSMDKSANKNLRSFCRAFLILTGVVMILLTGVLLGLMVNN